MEKIKMRKEYGVQWKMYEYIKLPHNKKNIITKHTPYSWNIMCHKSEGNCGLWVLNEITLKKYAENLKKIVGAVWELPAK